MRLYLLTRFSRETHLDPCGERLSSRVAVEHTPESARSLVCAISESLFRGGEDADAVAASSIFSRP